MYGEITLCKHLVNSPPGMPPAGRARQCLLRAPSQQTGYDPLQPDENETKHHIRSFPGIANPHVCHRLRTQISPLINHVLRQLAFLRFILILHHRISPKRSSLESRTPHSFHSIPFPFHSRSRLQPYSQPHKITQKKRKEIRSHSRAAQKC